MNPSYDGHKLTKPVNLCDSHGNLDSGWTDGTGMNENGFCLDGKLTKLSEDMQFSYNPSDFM